MNVKEQLLDIYVLGMKQKESKLPVLEKYVINGKKKKKKSMSKDLYPAYVKRFYKPLRKMTKAAWGKEERNIKSQKKKREI